MNRDDLNIVNRRIVLLGAGGHAKVLLDALTASGGVVRGLIDSVAAESRGSWRGIPIMGSDEDLLKIDSCSFVLVNGIGSLPGQNLRQSLFIKFKAAGFEFLKVMHPSVLVGTGVVFDEGVQLMAGSIIQADTSIGANSIINTGAIIDHDCVIGSNVHIAPGVVISGGVSIGNGAHIGTGVSIIQGIAIGAGAVIGAGTVVVKDVPTNHKLLGPSPKPSAIMNLERL